MQMFKIKPEHHSKGHQCGHLCKQTATREENNVTAVGVLCYVSCTTFPDHTYYGINSTSKTKPMPLFTPYAKPNAAVTSVKITYMLLAHVYN